MLFPPASVEDVTAPFLAGDFAKAAARFEVEFVERYFRGTPATIVEGRVEWVRLWADGDPEPRGPE